MDRRKIALGLRNAYRQDLRSLYMFIVGQNTSRDYIFWADALGTKYDIQSELHMLKAACRPETRVVLNWHNFLWQPALNLAEGLGFKSKQLQLNWLSDYDIYNLLTLEGFEVIKSGRRYLWPVPLGGIEKLINKYLASLPLVSTLCLTNYVVARVLPSAIRPSLSVIIAARNERGNIEKLVKGIIKATKSIPEKELIFVEGHSHDKTWEEIKRIQKKYKRTRIVATKQPGIGKADAVRKGLSLARNDILAIWDADISVDPADLPKFYNAIASGKGEFIFGSRLVYPLEKEAMRTLNILGNKVFSWIFSWLLGQPIKDTLCGTKIISKRNYLKLVKNRKYFGDFDPFGDFDLIFGAAKLNLKFVEIPVRYLARTYGRTNISRWAHGWLLLKMVFIAAGKLKFV